MRDQMGRGGTLRAPPVPSNIEGRLPLAARLVGRFFDRKCRSSARQAGWLSGTERE